MSWFPLNEFEYINIDKFYKVSYRIARVDGEFVAFIIFGILENEQEEVLGCVLTDIEDEIRRITGAPHTYLFSLDTIEIKVRDYLLKTEELTDIYDKDELSEKVIESTRYKEKW